MKRPVSPVEAKPAFASIAAFIVSGVFAFDGFYHWFTPPPAYLVTILVTAATAVAGYLAPHTSRPVNPTINEIAAAAHTLGLDVSAVGVRRTPAPEPAEPVVQPPATTTGPAT
jgi:fatty acid desaturase